MKKIILLIVLIFLLCGCSKKECVKSHQEDSICTYTRCMPISKTVMCIPYTLPCKKTICDEYKEVE